MRKGFTLIELLIVIAIIAILALIAIPNFMEAQVRSRVSRVHADMRSIATAIESYITDYNVPALGYNAYGDITGNPKWWSYNQLTTPVAYLTSPLSDPFVDKTRAVNAQLKPRNRDPYYDYQTYYPFPFPPGGDSGGATEKLNYSLGFVWSLASAGPSRRWDTPWIGGMISGEKAVTNIYDPTNGTVSQGFIWRTNRGVGLQGTKRHG